MLAIESLSKRLGGHLAVDDVSFTVQDGEFFVLLGPSGGGKSTLLKLVCGLETPDAGTVTLNGRDITRLPPRERNVGMVFQDYGLYPNMNVYDNIAYGLQARNMPRAEVETRVVEAAGRLGLGDFLKRLTVDMSGGEQQRVALARAMAKDADVYLYDEPLSNLDPKLRFSARHDIMKVHRLKGKPSLYVTHDQNEAFTMADRIGVIGHGRLQQIGTPDEILQRPANLFMARFIGSPPMNLLRGWLEREGGAARFVSDGLTVRLPERFDRPLHDYSADTLVLGFRPEAVWRAAGAPEPGEGGTFTAQATEVEPLIGETAVMLTLGSSNGLYAVFSDDGSEVREGQTLSLTFDPEGICLFDPESERALTA